MHHVTPNTKPFFIQNLCTNIVSEANTLKIIIAGDWNTTLHSIDKHGEGRPWHETNYGNSLLNFMDELGRDDAYRVLHPQRKLLPMSQNL